MLDEYKLIDYLVCFDIPKNASLFVGRQNGTELTTAIMMKIVN